MVQTLLTVIALLVVGAAVQTNMSVIHTQTPLRLPGDSGEPVTHLRLLAAIGAAAALVWLGGMLDLALMRARLRRRDAAVLALERDLVRVKAAAYEQQQPVLYDVRGQLEGVVRELRGMVARIETVLRGISGRAPREAGAPPAPAGTAVWPEAAAAPDRPVVRPDEPKEYEEVGAPPRKRWPL